MIKQFTFILRLNCREASQLLSDRSERSLKWYERCALRMHLLICRGCRRYRSYLATIRAALHPKQGPEAEAGKLDSLASELDADAILTADTKARLKRLLEHS